ncbi:MAG: hypothetical protein RL218_885 [Actinomycetota bacterium]
MFSAVDVARRHFGHRHRGFIERNDRAVVGHHRATFERPRKLAVEDDDLSPRGGIVHIGECFPIHADITKRLFDETIRLARDDEPVFG